MDETLRTVFMGITTLVAVFSPYITIRLWRKSNCPIVSALVETHLAGNVATTYRLLIINSGNRPAVNIRLSLKLSDEEFKKCISQEINDSRVEDIRKCFRVETTIPLLLNGDKTANYFGITSDRPKDNIWIYGSCLPIEIHYQDLEGKSYTSVLTLVVKNSRMFADTDWVEKRKP